MLPHTELETAAKAGEGPPVCFWFTEGELVGKLLLISDPLAGCHKEFVG